MPTEHPMSESSVPGEIVSVREFNASRERVFAAYADPAQLCKWWGPKGFTCTIHEFDLRVDGLWRLTLHGPDGANYENEKRFVEVDVPEKVAFDHIQPTHKFRMTMTWVEDAGKTRLSWRMQFDPPEEGEKLREFIAKANEENFDRLAAFLA